MRVLSSMPFCPCDGRRVSPRYLSAAARYTTLQCLQLVSSAMAAALLGAFAERFRSDARPWWGLRRDWEGLASPGAPDVYVVASGARGHSATLDISLLHDA